jgi:hypothetical protein
LEFCEKTAFSGTFPPDCSCFPDFQRNNPQGGDYLKQITDKNEISIEYHEIFDSISSSRGKIRE